MYMNDRKYGLMVRMSQSFLSPSMENETATHSNILAWRIPGTGEPGGRSSMGSHRVGHD